MNVGDIVGRNAVPARGLTPYRDYTVIAKAGPFIKVRNDFGQETDWLKATSFYEVQQTTITHIRYVSVVRYPERQLDVDIIQMATSIRDLNTLTDPYLRMGYVQVSKKMIKLPVPRREGL